jgi:hypothetical protein
MRSGNELGNALAEKRERRSNCHYIKLTSSFLQNCWAAFQLTNKKNNKFEQKIQKQISFLSFWENLENILMHSGILFRLLARVDVWEAMCICRKKRRTECSSLTVKSYGLLANVSLIDPQNNSLSRKKVIQSRYRLLQMNRM